MRQSYCDGAAHIVGAQHVQRPRTLVGNRQNSVVRQPLYDAFGGHLVQVTSPGNLATTYAYDTSVPLLLGGAGIKPGRYTQRVSTLDIAPTLSTLLGVLQPSGCEGHVLSPALKP